MNFAAWLRASVGILALQLAATGVAATGALTDEGQRSTPVSLSAMLEVAGLELAAETMPPTVETRQRMILTAREIDRMRRVRK